MFNIPSATPFQTLFLNDLYPDLDASTFDVRLQVTDIANLNNEVNGAIQEDIMNLMGGDDVAFGNTGNDTIAGGTGHDLLYGGDDDDLIYGNDGMDTIYGDAGDDVIYGNAQDDELYGMTGDDQVFGGSDDDRIFGNEGDDTLTGGSGGDEFVFVKGQDLINEYVDVITDFNVEEDTIVFKDFGFENTVFDTNEGFFLELLEAAGDVQQQNNDLIIEGSPGGGSLPAGATNGSNPIDLLDFGDDGDSYIVIENVRYDQLGDFSIEFEN